MAFCRIGQPPPGLQLTSKPPACLDTNLRRERDKRGIPGDNPTPTNSRGRTPRPVQDQMFSAGAPPIQNQNVANDSAGFT